MPVRVPHTQPPPIPGHISWRPRHFETLLETVLVDGIDIVYPDRHPRTLVADLIAVGSECGFGVAFTSASLSIFAKEDFALARADGTKRRRTSPIPALLPAELLKPSEALFDIRDVKYGSQSFCDHFRFPPRLGKS